MIARPASSSLSDPSGRTHVATILPVLADSDIVSSASEADDLLIVINRVLDSGDTVILDFAGVNGVEPAFVDALLDPLHDRLGDTLPDHVLLENCSASVLTDLRNVAETGRPALAGAAAPTRAGRHAA